MIRAQRRTETQVGHAKAIQQRRVDAGKRGYSKAVRRWLKSKGDMYLVYKCELPVKW